MCDDTSMKFYTLNWNTSGLGNTTIGEYLYNLCLQLKSQSAVADSQNQSLSGAFSQLTSIYNMNINMDFFFMFILAALVFFMQFGFGLFEAGMLKNPKTLKRTLLKNYLCTMMAMIVWWLFGYALAYGHDNVFVGGQYYWAFSNMAPSNFSHFWANYAFAATSLSVALGAWAERVHMIVYLVFAFVWVGIVYPFPVHWAWGYNGWLLRGITSPNTVSAYQQISVVDVSGAGIVHITGGAAALAGAIIFWRRPGRVDKISGRVLGYKQHSSVLLFTGASIVQLGMIALAALGQWSIRGDSNLPFVQKPKYMGEDLPNSPTAPFAAQAMYNTLIAGAVSSAIGYIFSMVLARRWHSEGLSKVLCAGLAGMVAQSASAGFMYPWCAFLTGIGAGIAYVSLRLIVLNVLKIDDVTDAFAVHCGGGIVGLVMSGFLSLGGFSLAFSREPYNKGFFFLWECVAAASFLAWALLTAIPLLGLLRVIVHFGTHRKEQKKAADGEAAADAMSAMGAGPFGSNVYKPPHSDAGSVVPVAYAGPANIPPMINFTQQPNGGPAPAMGAQGLWGGAGGGQAGLGPQAAMNLGAQGGMGVGLQGQPLQYSTPSMYGMQGQMSQAPPTGAVNYGSLVQQQQNF